MHVSKNIDIHYWNGWQMAQNQSFAEKKQKINIKYFIALSHAKYLHSMYFNIDTLISSRGNSQYCFNTFTFFLNTEKFSTFHEPTTMLYLLILYIIRIDIKSILKIFSSYVFMLIKKKNVTSFLIMNIFIAKLMFHLSLLFVCV